MFSKMVISKNGKKNPQLISFSREQKTNKRFFNRSLFCFFPISPYSRARINLLRV